MNFDIDHAARIAAAFAAVVIVAGPFAASAIHAGWQYAKARFAFLFDAQKDWAVPFSTKAVFAAFLAYVAITGPHPVSSTASRLVAVVAPEGQMKQKVSAISVAMNDASQADRLNWADVWMKSAAVVAGEATSSEVVFTDTRSLRAFTIISLEIGWRRLGGNNPGKFPGLREAVESVFKDFLTDEIKPVTKEMRDNYVQLAKAIAWAGMAKE